jgi:hypothetical protein
MSTHEVGISDYFLGENLSFSKAERRLGKIDLGKSHAVDLIIIRSMLEKERGGTLKKTLSL